MLDLARVGSGEGPDVALVGELRARVPGARAARRRRRARRRATCARWPGPGAAGALVATALHGGAIGADELRALR